MHINPKGIEKVVRYVKNRAEGKNRRKSALLAGFAELTANTPQKIELSQNYQLISATMLLDNASSMQKLLAKIGEKIDNGEVVLNINELKTYTECLKNLSQVQKTLAPEIKIRDTKDKDGTTRRTIWATGSVQQAEAIAQTPLE